MNLALALSLFAVTISLGTVFIAAQSKKAKKPDNRDGSDSSVMASSDSGTDCSPADSGGCDGGGGGGGD